MITTVPPPSPSFVGTTSPKRCLAVASERNAIPCSYGKPLSTCVVRQPSHFFRPSTRVSLVFSSWPSLPSLRRAIRPDKPSTRPQGRVFLCMSQKKASPTFVGDAFVLPAPGQTPGRARVLTRPSGQRYLRARSAHPAPTSRPTHRRHQSRSRPPQRARRLRASRCWAHSRTRSGRH